ncbi:MAG: hypothetical protein HKN46_03055 [Acidimicrobiia bacterium]|nr:hypothetical protein [Acidimicrobiia bacterium]
MGKALIFIVLGSGLILSRQFLDNTEHERRSNEDRTEYQEEVIAREIAASAFNVAMGEIRAHGEDLHGAVEAFNGTAGGREGTYSTGRFVGGRSETRAQLTSGHSVRVVATGFFGGAEHTMHDEYRVPVLIAREDGIIEVSPNNMTPDECAAIFFQAYPIGADPANLPEPEMIYASWDGDRQSSEVLQSMYATAGTQLNFWLAIDSNCSERVDVSSSQATGCQARADARDYTFDPDDWDAILPALEIEEADITQAKEGTWSYVLQDPSDRQQWSITWEDQTAWNAPNSTDPTRSVQALKAFGYDGDGWTYTSGSVYTALTDYGTSRPDFSDHSISITLHSTESPNYKGKQQSILARQKSCGEAYDEPLDGDEYDTDGDGEAEVEAEPEPTPSTEPEPESEAAPPNGFSEQELIDYACACTSNGTQSNKTAILHRPPGNESNEQLICIGNPAVPPHFDNHNDVFPTCESGQAVRNNNGRKNR